MIDGIFEGVIKGVVIGAAIGLLLAGLLKAIANSKSAERGVNAFDRTLSGFIENPFLTSTVGKSGGVTVNEDNLYFVIGDKFMKPIRFKIPYSRVLKFELCGKFEPKDTPPELEDIPNHFTVEFIMDDGSQHTLSFDQTNVKKNIDLDKYYPNNIFDLVNERMEKAKNTSPSTDSPSKN